MIKRDERATELAGFRDRESYIGNRIHPGTQHACRYLAGEDVRLVRQNLVRNAQGRCEDCGHFVGAHGDMDHVIGGLGPERCYCEENLRYRCKACHIRKTARSPMMGRV